MICNIKHFPTSIIPQLPHKYIIKMNAAVKRKQKVLVKYNRCLCIGAVAFWRAVGEIGVNFN